MNQHEAPNIVAEPAGNQEEIMQLLTFYKVANESASKEKG